MRPKKVSFYLQKLTVAGHGTFPFDMLRYDRCWPAGEDQSAALYETRERREVKLMRITNQDMPPTIGRWNSFNWTVESFETLSL